MKQRLLTHHLPLLLWLMFIYTLSDIPTLEIQAFGFADFIFRKIAHFTEYFILAILFYRMFDKKKKKALFIVLSFFFALVYAISDEWHQTFILGRVGTFSDVIIDSLGAVAGLWIWSMNVFQKTKKNPKRKVA